MGAAELGLSLTGEKRLPWEPRLLVDQLASCLENFQSSRKGARKALASVPRWLETGTQPAVLEEVMATPRLVRKIEGQEWQMMRQRLTDVKVPEEMIDPLLRIMMAEEPGREDVDKIIGQGEKWIKLVYDAKTSRTMMEQLRLIVARGGSDSKGKTQSGYDLLPETGRQFGSGMGGRDKKPKKDKGKKDKGEREAIVGWRWGDWRKAGCAAALAMATVSCCGLVFLGSTIVSGWNKNVSGPVEALQADQAGEWERAEALRLHQRYEDVTHAGVENADTRLTNILSGAEPEADKMLRFDLGIFGDAGSELSGRQLGMALGWHDALKDVGLINQDGRLDPSERSLVIERLKQLRVSPQVAEQFWQRFFWAYDHFDDYGIDANRDKAGLEQQRITADRRMSSGISKQRQMLRRGVPQTRMAATGLFHRGQRRS